MATARAPKQEVASAEIIASMNQGYNGYNDPTTTRPQQWLAAVNVFSGAFGFIQRARFATIVAGTTPVGITTAFYNHFINTVTITTAANHNFMSNQFVNIDGVLDPIFNGFFQITVTGPTTFTYLLPLNLGDHTSSGGFTFIVYPTQGTAFTSLKYYAIPGVTSYLLADNNGKLFSFASGASYNVVQRLNPYVDPNGFGLSTLNGPWSREVLQNIVYEMNGQVKQTGRSFSAAIVEGFGLDTPDVSPQVVISAGTSQTITNIQRSNNTVTVTVAGALTVPGGNGIGMVNVTITAGDTSFAGTFLVLTGSGTATLTWAQQGQNTALLTPTGTVNTSITKSVGRSYSWAWENANKVHVGAPSPSTQYIQYTAQNGAIQLIQQGTITRGVASTIITGTGTAFTSAWVGRVIWSDTVGSNVAGWRIVSVQSATQLTVASNTGANVTNAVFQVYDPQSTHVRLYETADGGSTYLRTQRNVFNPVATSLVTAGLQFFDNAQSEPPSFPFTTETSQLFNIPPPVGAFLKEYQGRLVIYGIPGLGQTFFYTNNELTNIGLPQESCAPLNQVTLPIQNANINGMAEFPGSLIIWSDKQDMFRLTGLLTDNSSLTGTQQGASLSALPYNLGCATPYSVALTPLGAIWLTTNGEVWLFTDRYAPRNIGRPVQDVLNNIPTALLSQARATYYHTDNRNWYVLSVPNGSSNNTLLILDLDLLASNGSPSYFVFDMATNQPVWFKYAANASAIETMYEAGGAVRLLVGATDIIQDVDYQTSLFGTETPVPNATLTTHAWGNDHAFILKRPGWFRFNTNRDPSVLDSETILPIAVSNGAVRSGGLVTITTSSAHGLQAGDWVFIAGVTDSSFAGVFQVNATPTSTTLTYLQAGTNSSSGGGVLTSGWNFQVSGIDDDFYTFNSPLVVTFIPGLNDTSSLSGNPALSNGAPFRHSPELFRVGGVNFVMGRRLLFTVNFPSGVGVPYQIRSIQIGFGASPPR